VTAEKALFFEPAGMQTRRLLDLVIPRLQASAGARLAARQKATGGSERGGGGGSSEAETYLREAGRNGADGAATAPFELEVLEGVLMVTTGELGGGVAGRARGKEREVICCRRRAPPPLAPSSPAIHPRPPPPLPPRQAGWSAR
jgi:hypothetical protein